MSPPAGSVPMFSERIEKRVALWIGDRRDYVRRFHRVREILTMRRRSDADDDWRCCELWQRQLSNKWNAREFAQKHGCRVAELYWCGRRVRKLPFGSLPSHYVIRPTLGDSGRETYVIAGGTDLMSRKSYTTAQLRREIQRSRGARTALRAGLIATMPLLVEEFVRSEAGEHELPIEYKFHTFGETIAAIQVIQRSERNVKTTKHNFYTPEWEMFTQPMVTHRAPGTWRGPPGCLDEMLTYARRLGTVYGTYVRVDLYATDRGCVFGEFGPTPAHGHGFSQYANEYLGRLWQELMPDRV